MFYKQIENQFSYRRLVSFFMICFFLTALLPVLKTEAAIRVQPTEYPIVIVIDPGHGGKNEGTIENGFQEKSMTMVTAMAMYDELRQYDNVQVYLTRTDDRDMSLEERAEFAASVQADFLFSIHYNASVNHNLFGSEVWTSLLPPFHSYGYQFGMIHLQNMQDMGLFLRGVKTRQGDDGSDYYGIIRESVALNVPAVIIEHCHVDEERDVPFCDEEENLIAFGKADATSVAQYFGLKSTALSVDYSAEANLAEVSSERLVSYAVKDETVPEICFLELIESNLSTGEMILDVSAADYDGMLLYYDYSIDGGQSYSALQPWPGSNAIDYTYSDSFTLNLQIPSGVQPDVILRAYNLFDLSAESNMVHSLSAFRYGETDTADTSIQGNTEEQLQQDIASTEESSPSQIADGYFLPTSTGGEESSQSNTFLIFVIICILFVMIILTVVIGSQLAISRRRRRKLHQRLQQDFQHKKDAGDRRNHPK